MVALCLYIFGFMIPETYARQILRRRARKAGVPPKLEKALSGETLAEMSQITIVTPVKMLFSEPIVIFATLYVSFLFGTIFQFFISIPPVLMMTYNFTLQHVGLAFIAALVGAFLATATTTAIDKVAYPLAVKKSGQKKDVDIEYRLFPAMLGGIFITTSFFWIGWTAKPTVDWPSPVLGTLLFVWGNMMVLVSFALCSQSSLLGYSAGSFPLTRFDLRFQPSRISSMRTRQLAPSRRSPLQHRCDFSSEPPFLSASFR